MVDRAGHIAQCPRPQLCIHASSTAAWNTLSKRHCVIMIRKGTGNERPKPMISGGVSGLYASGRFREAHGMQTAAHDALTRSICHSKPFPSWRRNLASILWLAVERLETEKTVSGGTQCDHLDTSTEYLASNGIDRLRLPCQWSQDRDA